MFEKTFIWQNFFATVGSVSAFKLEFAKQILGHSVDLAKHSFIAAIRTLDVFSYVPLVHASTADWFLTLFALKWIVENHVANTA